MIIIIFVILYLGHREDQFTESANVSIFTGTWNVNAKKLDGELNDWLLNEQGGESINLLFEMMRMIFISSSLVPTYAYTQLILSKRI